jgi:hypothetical protein
MEHSYEDTCGFSPRPKHLPPHKHDKLHRIVETIRVYLFGACVPQPMTKTTAPKECRSKQKRLIAGFGLSFDNLLLPA